MSPGSNAESYPAFALSGLRENPEKKLDQNRVPHGTITSWAVSAVEFTRHFISIGGMEPWACRQIHICTTSASQPVITVRFIAEMETGSAVGCKLYSHQQSAVKNLKVRIYKTVILPVVLYGCETWTLTLREEQRLRVFENKVLRNIFGAKRDEVTGEWRKLHNAELQALYSSPVIIRIIKSRRLRWAGHVARMGESRNAYRVLVGKSERKRPLGRPRRRWEDNIKMDLREVGYDGRDWINLAQDRDQWRAYVRAAMNLRVS
ncbi:hypothetical protein ANN_11433 [Periplaneta americana]|uniref:Endonuclease-reverse transcriptase n=1 Tax=Periplaneta americana TaxID=6978 RepID=A0ABQ8T6T2_PERAM|nr:hypothetical protein ANN_11433 [Periplaneta americana]